MNQLYPKQIPIMSKTSVKRPKFASFPKKGIPSYILRGSKYNNIPSQYKGRLYHSKFEAEYAMILDDMVRTGEIKSWQPQYTLRLDINGKHICNYISDFKIILSDGSEQIHESKGFFTPVGKLKFRLAQALYPNLKFILIK